MLTRTLVSSIVAIVLLAAANGSQAAKSEVLVRSTDVTVHEESAANVGDYYTIGFEIPQETEGRTFFGATLELFVDAASGNGVDVPGPLLEVYGLRSAFTGSLDSGQFMWPPTSVSRVEVGEGRRVLFDISEIVEQYLKSSNTNHGLILGSLTGDRSGLFTLRDNMIGENVVARVTFHYDGRIRK